MLNKYKGENEMVDKTKSIDVMQVPDHIASKVMFYTKKSMLRETFNQLLKKLKKIILTDQKYKWIKIQNKPFYYVTKEDMIIVDIERKHVSATKLIDVKEFNMGNMGLSSAENLFSNHKSSNPWIKNGKVYDYIDYIDEETGKKYIGYDIWIGEKNNTVYNLRYNCAYSDCCIDDTKFLKLPIYALNPLQLCSKIQFFIKNNLNVFSDKMESACFEILAKLYNNEKIIYDTESEQIKFNDKFEEDDILELLDKNKFKILNSDFSDKAVKSLLSQKITFDSDVYNFLRNELLSCDEIRVHMEKYSEHILKDPESGHWDLWYDENDKNKKGLEIKLEGKIISRNPAYDALTNRSGIVGIDFGTKSTVVTYRQSRADILPMRVGSGQYKRAVSMNDYENPTVMELRDIVSFKEDYKMRDGRPLTHWNDLLISHEAFSQLKDEQRSGDTFANFFSELKQWANDKERQVTLRDANGVEIDIPPYMKVGDEDFDPIEIYAYYLGMFINNMEHKIYLRYKMSFPAKIEKAVRDKILNSFKKGITKSLPQTVLDNEECMKIFRVEQGASEPAAYAICALQEYGFDLEDDEKIYYGIFDFGGGTTDFDFGIWSNSDEDDDNHDYKISRFGEGEDPYLGGENILEILAYNVFLDNYEKLRKDDIVFIKPYGEKDIAGRDWLISQDSQYAHFNSKHMMEKLRGVWENDEEIRNNVKSGTIQLNLFDRGGESHQNFALAVSLEKLDDIIEQRIESGVKQFFSTLKNCFDKGNSFEKVYKLNELNIFLAGNSCKSKVVFKIFKKYIDQLYKEMSKNENKKWIKVYPPLGSEQALKVQAQKLEPDIDQIIADMTGKAIESTSEEIADDNNMDYVLEKINRPNGKTGVAFGLLDTRVKIEQNESAESSFKYYLGQNRKKKFKCIIDKDKQEYGKWKRFCSASVDTFDIWFTRTADAPSDKVSIHEIGIYLETGFVDEPSEEKNVYIRLVSPTDIEYMVSSLSEEELNKTQTDKGDIKRITLQEK